MKAGRPISAEGLYAKSLGITTRELKRMGGMEKSLRMSDAARAFLMPKRMR
jgi:hypothetical protein